MTEGQRSPRARKTLSRRELTRFLALLAENGNFALACLALGRAKSGLYKRRTRDPLFDAQCKGALAQSRSSLLRSPGEVPRATRRSGPYAIVLGTYAGRPQLRRAAPGTLTQAGRERFLHTLCLTGNIRFAAASVGVAHSSILHRRDTDAAFAAELRAALEASRDALQMRLIEASGAFDRSEEPFPHAGEGKSAEPAGETGLDDEHSFTTRMTISQAIRLVTLLDKQLERNARNALEAGPRRAPPDPPPLSRSPAQDRGDGPGTSLPPAHEWPSPEPDKAPRAMPRVRRL